jgi:hypothetical protein
MAWQVKASNGMARQVKEIQGMAWQVKARNGMKRKMKARQCKA